MADVGFGEHKQVSSSEEQKPSKPQLEQLDRDELVKQIKKQLMLLQRLKLKCDDMNKKNTTLETELNERNSECTELKEKLELVESEKCDRNSKIASLELDKLNLTRSVKAFEEQVECMALKQETASTTFQCLQDEIKKLQAENKKLTEDVSVLTAARDEALLSLKSIKGSLSSELADAKQQLLNVQEAHREAIKENKILSEEIETSCCSLKTIQLKHSELEKNHNELQNQCEFLNSGYLSAKDKIAQLEESFASCMQSLESVTVERDNLTLQLQNYHELENEVQELRCREKADKETLNQGIKAELDETKMRLQLALDENFLLEQKVEDIQSSNNSLQLRFNEVESKNAGILENYSELQKQKQTLNEALLCSEARIKSLENSLADAENSINNLNNEVLSWAVEKKNHEHLQQQLNDFEAIRSSLQHKIDSQETVLSEVYQFANSLLSHDKTSDECLEYFNSNIDLLQLLKDTVLSITSFRTAVSPEKNEEQIIESLEARIVKFEVDNSHLLDDMKNLESLILTLDSKVTNLEAEPKTKKCSVACETKNVTYESVGISTDRIESIDVFTEITKECLSEIFDHQKCILNSNVPSGMQSVACGNDDGEVQAGKVDAYTEISEECFVIRKDIPDGNMTSIVNVEKMDESTETDEMYIHCKHNKCLEKVDVYTETIEDWLTSNTLIHDDGSVEKVEKWTEIDESFIHAQVGGDVDSTNSSISVPLNVSSLNDAVVQKQIVQPEVYSEQLQEKAQAIEHSLRNIFHVFEDLDEVVNKNDNLCVEFRKVRLHLDALRKLPKDDSELAFLKELQRLDVFCEILFNLNNILLMCVPELKAQVQALTKDEDVKEAAVKTKELHNTIEKLERDLKDAEDLVIKYKNVAIKMKKEAVELRKQISDINSELQKSSEERDHLKNQMERLSSQLAVVTKEKSAVEDKEKLLELQLIQERDKHKIMQNKLDHALKEATKSNLISLEIADYERLMKDLNKQMENKTVEIDKLKTEVNFHQEKSDGYIVQIGQLEEQKLQSEARAEQLKALTVKLKSEIADFQKVERDWKTLESFLSAQLEAASREIENYKLQIATTLADNQRLQESCRAMQDAHIRAICLLESRNSGLLEELQKVKSDYASCQLEFEGYKVRVHSVLKSKKSKLGSVDSPVVGSGSHATDIKTDEKDQLEKAIEALQTRIQELVAQLATVQGELETLQEEHDNLLQRHNKLVLNINEQDLSWKQRVEKLQKDLLNEQKEHADVLRHIQQQHQLTLDLSLKQQIESLQKEHSQMLEEMQLKLDLAHDELLRLQKEVVDAKLTSAALTKDDDVIVDILNTERQEGEGSEFTDNVFGTPQKSSPPASGFVPLDQLLNQDKLSVSSVSALETEKLENQLAVATRRIEHMTEILHENEAANARLTEQTRVLKEEIRRLERNQEREKHLANMEYVKNVIIKFLSLPSGDEREHLLPVLTMLLRLSREEEHQLHGVAKGTVQSETLSGWGSYLPKWPGT